MKINHFNQAKLCNKDECLQLLLRTALFALEFIVLFEIAIGLIVRLKLLMPMQAQIVQNEQLGEFTISHNLVDRKNPPLIGLVDGSDLVALMASFEIRIMISGRNLLLNENVSKFGAHDCVQTVGKIMICQSSFPTFGKNIIIMRTTEFELTHLRRADKVLDFKSIDPNIQKNINRLLNQQSQDVQGESEYKNVYCWLYIDPLSSFTLYWNLFYMLIFYIIQLQISLSLAFGPHFFENELALDKVYFFIYLFIVIFLAVDSANNFFKGYYAFGRGKVIDDFQKILPHYLKGQFIFDVIVWVIYLIPLIHQDYILNFLQLIPGALIWVKKFKYQNQIIAFLQYQAGLRAAFMLFILFIDVLMIGNYGACIFVGMDILLYNQQYYGDNQAYYWLTNNTSYPFSLINGPWYYQYIYGQEFSTGTLSTLAPGPFAKNPWEAFYAIVVMILFMVLASYVGEVLIQIVYTYTERRIFHEENIISFDNFMQLKAVDRNIRNRIYNFFELIWEVQLKMESKEQEAMIDKLPAYLKEELLLEIGFTKAIYFLSALPHQPSLQKMIALKLERLTIDSDTCIFEAQKQTAITPRNLYFIKEGMAKFYLADHQASNRSKGDLDVLNNVTREKILNLSNVEKVLGIYEFITGQDYAICCKSIDLCLIQKLSYPNFMQIVHELEIWEEFKKLQHQILIEREMTLIKKICVFCLQNHIESQCPDLFYNQRAKQQITENRRSRREQTRKPIDRKGFKSPRIHQTIQDKDRLKQSSIFSLFKNINLGKLILDINKLDGWQGQEIQQVAQFTNYYPEANLS